MTGSHSGDRDFGHGFLSFRCDAGNDHFLALEHIDLHFDLEIGEISRCREFPLEFFVAHITGNKSEILCCIKREEEFAILVCRRAKVRAFDKDIRSGQWLAGFGIYYHAFDLHGKGRITEHNDEQQTQ